MFLPATDYPTSIDVLNDYPGAVAVIWVESGWFVCLTHADLSAWGGV